MLLSSVAGVAFSFAAHADDAPLGVKLPAFDSGKLLATAGVTQIEGSGGGGLAAWSLITGYGTRDALGANAHLTSVLLPDFRLYTAGAAIGLYDRVELSYTHQWFDTGSTGKALGLGSGYLFQVDVIGAKLKVLGDAIYDQDSLLPQIAVGVDFKFNDRAAVLHAIGARSDHGVDYYIAATKLFLSQSLLLNATVRFTQANQFGILGFGGDRNAGYQPEFEGSAAYLLSRRAAVGAEYRTKPDNLRFARENNAFDIFFAYFFTKNVSATIAYADVGSVATRRNQRGAYLSLQVGF